MKDSNAGVSRVKKFYREFKEFAVKGNAVDLAVGVIIGAAFGKIVSSIVADIATPFIGMFLGGVDFSKWVINLPRFFNQLDPIQLKIGNFVNTVIEFLTIALVIFIFVKAINRVKKKKEEEPKKPTKEEELLAEIRDILKNK